MVRLTSGGNAGQSLGEMAEHVEGRRAVPEYHPGLQDRRRHTRAAQDLADLDPGRQVRGQFACRMQPGEVDDPRDAGLRGHRREPLGEGAVAGHEVTLAVH
jgi:hypothetical protein